MAAGSIFLREFIATLIIVKAGGWALANATPMRTRTLLLRSIVVLGFSALSSLQAAKIRS